MSEPIDEELRNAPEPPETPETPEPPEIPNAPEPPVLVDCPDTCCLSVGVTDDQIVQVRGSHANPYTAGALQLRK